MATKQVKIPFSKIKKIEYYSNSKRKTMSQIKKLTGCDYIINGGIYNGDWTPCPILKIDGKLISKNPWTRVGYGHNGDINSIAFTTNYNAYKNFLCCIELFDTKGNKISKLNYPSDMGGARQRSAIGITKNKELVLYCTNSETRPEKLRDIMANLGCISAMMLDGGGSSQCNFDGQIISSSRVVQNFILVYINKNSSVTPPMTEPNTGTTPKPSVDSGNKIIEQFMYNNLTYKNQVKCNKTKMMLHSTGTPGALFNNFFNSMNRSSATTSVEGIIDCYGIYKTLPFGIKSWHSGASANNTHIAVELCEPVDTRLLDANWRPLYYGSKGNTKWAVSKLQQELNAWGFKLDVDGSFGNNTRNAVINFQKYVDIAVDGSVGLGTLHALQKRDGSYLKYDPVKNADYFNNIYNKAVYFFADTLKKIGGKASDIVCHSEGYKLGIASNHADVMHWFPLHNKTMDDFRNDVAKAMGNSDYKPPVKPPVVNDRIVLAQQYLNNNYNSDIEEDGSWGPASKKAFIKAIQQAINKNYNKNLAIDGSWGPASKSACPDLQYYVKNSLVGLLQLGLYVKGYNIDIDNSYGPGCKSTVIAFQQTRKITANGIAGPITFTELVK